MNIESIFEQKMQYIQNKIESLGLSSYQQTTDSTTSTNSTDSTNSSANFNTILNNALGQTQSSTSTDTDSNSDSTFSLDTTNLIKSSFASSSSTAYDKYIEESSKKYNVDPDLVKAVIKQESNFDPNSVSSAGATGLMQLMPSTANSLGVSNINNSEENIEGGTKLLSELLSEFKDVKLALAAYNAGSGAVKKYNGVPPYSETTNYVNKVISNYNDYKNE